MTPLAACPPPKSYEQICSEHEWDVPERYNIAEDVCDKHPRDKPAMVHQDPDGNVRELDWGELQDLRAQAAHALAAAGVERGDRVAVVLPPTPETAAIFFGTWKLGALLLSMCVLYGDDGIRHRLENSGATVLVTNADNADRFTHDNVVLIDDGLLDGHPTEFETVDTAADDPAQLYYTSGTTGAAKGVVHAHRYILAHEEFELLPRGRGRREVPRHGRVGVGGRHLAAARAVAARRGPVRAAAQGRLRPEGASCEFLSRPRRHQRVRDADRDPLDDGHQGRRQGRTRASSAACAAPASC